MSNFSFKRLTAWLLTLVMLVGLVPLGIIQPAEAAGETVYVLAGSDYQADSGDAAGTTNINNIINAIKADGYTAMDGFLFAGDYSVGATKTSNVTALKNTILNADLGLTVNDMVLIQGNHDNSAVYGGTEAGLVGSVLNKSGANDTDDYGVFVINEEDYGWRGGSESKVKAIAATLETYLNAKRNAGYTKPIFVVSHLPLNYNMRTLEGDGMYANLIFDVLNEAGTAGLNIIFMFGHDHSNGWDDYLGGSAIYLKKNDKILIAQSSKTNYKEETLQFTYMNAGYVGYYRNVNTGSETDLTMTVFEITADEVTVKRYSASGAHDLKSKGVTNSYKNESGYAPNTTVYSSPQTITLNKTITPAGEEVEAPDVGNTATQRTYTRVTSTSELVSGGKYLIFYNGSHFMLPEVVEKSSSGTRKGFNIQSTSICGPDTISGDYTAKEWTLTSSGSGWLLGNGTQYAKLTNTTNYKVTATFENSGDVLTIGGSANAFTFSNGTYVFNYNDRGLINGYASDAAPFYIYRMTYEGSSGSTVETFGGNWVTVTEPTTAGTKYVYELDTDGIDTDVEYLIVANEYEKALSAAASNNNAVDIEIDGNFAYATSDTYGWTFTYDSGYYIRLNDSTYLRFQDNELSSSTSAGNSNNQKKQRRWNVESNRDGSYKITSVSNNSYELRWSNSNNSFQVSSSSDGPVRLYKFVKRETTQAQTGLYGMIEGELTYNVANGTSKEDALTAVKRGITIKYHNGDANAAQTFPDDGEGMTWTLDPSYNASVGGEYAVTIKYNGVTLGRAKVVVPSVNITGYSVEPAGGIVNKGVPQSTQTGALIYVQLENDTYYTIPVTVAMLTKADGSAVSTGEVGTLDNLTLTYNGVVITNQFHLDVVAKNGNNYPQYPDEGAVKVNKTAAGIDFQSSGIAQIEISASGVPVKKGADVIVMLDTSSSMNNTVDGVTRISVLQASLENMLKQLKANGDDGKPMDIRIAVADFNRYYLEADSPYYINENDHLASGSIRKNDAEQALVYTGTEDLTAGAFVAVHSLNDNHFSENGRKPLNTNSGTNYDYAFDAIYQLGEAIITQNAAEGTERDLFVVFMSDGAPFQFNYFSAQSGSSTGTTEASYWNNWLQGTIESNMISSEANNSYYNEDGKHWMAEAIKGDPSQTYPVIRKNNPADTDNDNWVMVNGLGATMYSIGFCLEKDKEITVESMDAVIQAIASDEKHYFRADDASKLNTAFTQIGNAIAYAANNARFVDRMGESFNLQMEVAEYKVVTATTDANGNPVSTVETKTLTPKIEIISYEIYTRQDYEQGTITIDKIGDRTGKFEILETITFNEDGTEAYSDQVDGGQTNILADGTVDGFIKGVIYAKYFLYNTNSKAVEVQGVNIPTSINTNLTTSGSTSFLPAETFYWKMGTVQTSELAMRYYVYLDGSMEGEKPAGSYATNTFATLYYDNYLEAPCFKDTVSPTVAWKSANVKYAFYLVNENGEIIVNQSTGETGSFANKIAVTEPVLFDEVLLNNDGTVKSLSVASLDEGVLPKYYTLYDETSTYYVAINSNSTGAWRINNANNTWGVGDDGEIGTSDDVLTPVTTEKVYVPSTYVTGFSGAEYSKDLRVDEIGYDYTHTTVWFAVKWELAAHPDTIVVDYGQPVDIHVLTNDMFGENVALVGVREYDETKTDENQTLLTNAVKHNAVTEDIIEGFGTTYEGKYGSVTVDTSNNTIRYSLNSMSMDSYEKFAYAVHYTGSDNAGYYYDTVTVIPATTIYYEEKFMEYHNGISNEGYGVWTDAGEFDDALQDEDRPGFFSLASVDRNNVYGYDGINKSSTIYSLGSAKKVTVNASVEQAPYAKFTFTGTGFDVISLTDSDAGLLVVEVYEKGAALGDTTKLVRSYFVNNYYGYEYKDGKWVITTATPDTIWQVPVMKISGLTYGTYDAYIVTSYGDYFDTNKDGKYSFYLDSIRIYDPADDGVKGEGENADTTIKDAYIVDKEYSPYYVTVKDRILNGIGYTAAGELFFDTNKNGTKDENEELLNETSELNGAVFIDGKSATSLISDYANPGPNNEAYLADGQSVSFNLVVTYSYADKDIIESTTEDTGTAVVTTNKIKTYEPNVQLGAKLGFGQQVLMDVNTNPAARSIFRQELKTATDMYYTIPVVWEDPQITGDTVTYVSKTITITNITGNTDSLLSLTNLKVTDVPTTLTKTETNTKALAEYTPASADYAVPAYDAAATNTVTLVADLNTIRDGLAVSEYLLNESTDTPAEVPEEDTAFKPEVFGYSITSSLIGKNKSVTVITSKDVKSVTVNGKAMTNMNNLSLFTVLSAVMKEMAKGAGLDLASGEYIVWTKLIPSAKEYKLIAKDFSGNEAEPVIANGNETNITVKDVEDAIRNNNVGGMMQEIAAKMFNPVFFDTVIARRADGRCEAIVKTSEDVQYVMVDGAIVNHYITETVIDLSTDETTVNRVFVTEVQNESAEVTAYNEEGTASSSVYTNN